MPLLEFKQGSMLCNAGEPLRHLYFITKGSVESSFNGYPFDFSQGDTVGLNALTSGSHTQSFKAKTDVTVFSYQYDDFTSLESLMRDNADVANLFVSSMNRQIYKYMQYRAVLKAEAEKAYKIIKEVIPLYERLCTLYVFSPKKMPNAENIQSPSANDGVKDWLSNFYSEIKETEPVAVKNFFRKPGVSTGFMRRCAEDIFTVQKSCKMYQDYLRNISWLFISGSGVDLFSLVSELHLGSINIKGADAAVGAVMNTVTSFLSKMTYIDQTIYQKRIESYTESLTNKKSNQVITEVAVTGDVKQNLADSISVILEYSSFPIENANKFRKYVNDYTELKDKASSDDVAHHLRRELTTMFNELYQQILIKSLKEPNPPTIIKMFLNFGYVDAKLAGADNADYLYSIADTLKGDPKNGVYTLSEWMAAIYTGKREPCRNEFDMDYAAYLQELKTSHKIDEKKEAELLKDNGEKLRFELENVFPVVNKLTFGRITIFCPLFSNSNVQRGLDASLVTSEALKNAFDEIRSIDFSAYYRETMYSNPEIGITKETVNVEILPEVILMPNIGVRGVMWQEIEGRKRTTHGRMFMPIFLLSDLRALVITLTGEFRWEMCKRVQGIRWNDVTDPSLTSEYCDYLQFYRTNRELSADVRAGVKTELTRARNNWKGVFVLNYIDWILYESNSSARLNKFARKIMSMYCPFSASIRENLSSNPQYNDHIKRYAFKQQQRETLLSRTIQKLSQTIKEVPQELINELEFVKK